MNKNKDEWTRVYLGFGLILSGELDEIKTLKEKINDIIKDLESIKVVYQILRPQKLTISETPYRHTGEENEYGE